MEDQFEVPRVRLTNTVAQLKAISAAHRQNQIVHGPALKELKEELPEKFGYKYVIPTLNGSLALSLALRLTQVDRISVPPLTTCESVRHAASEARVRWSVRQPSEFSPLASLLGERRGAVLSVGLFGRTEQIVPSSKPALLEDSAQAFSTRLRNHSGAKLLVLSFYPSKFPGGLDGGAILTSDKAIYEAGIELLFSRNQEGRSRGLNWGMSNLQATAILSVLPEIGHFDAGLLEKAQVLREFFFNRGLRSLPFKPGEVPTRFLLLFDSASEATRVKSSLRSAGVEASSELRFFYRNRFMLRQPAACDWPETVISIPFYYGIKERELEITMKKFLEIRGQKPSRI